MKTYKEIAIKKLAELETTWGEKYTPVIRSWQANWEELTAYFRYTKPIRKIIYTTNTVEGFNRQLRKVTKAKAVFPNEDALLKLIWLAAQNILKKWTSLLQNWALTAQQLYIHFPKRFKLDLNMGKNTIF